MKIPRRRVFKGLAASLGLAAAGGGLAGQTQHKSQTEAAVVSSKGTGPDSIYEKPLPITLADLAARTAPGVSAVEVKDYAPGGYKGEMTPSPHHADMNAKRAIIVTWKDKPHRFVFSHEASYCPWMELPNGVGLCNQFFEGNKGYAELFNDKGRKTRNSFVDVVRSGPGQVWVRWNYFCVNQDDDTQPALRGTEDYLTHPNGLMWRRLTYTTMMPDKPEGYSWQPIDYFALAPNGTEWRDLFPRDEEHNDNHIVSVLDLYSDKHYDVFWDDNGKARRNGDADLLLEISHSKGFAMVMPLKAGHLFTIIGAAGGFPPEKSQVVDHSFNDTGGWGWGAARWDHWPIGWRNAQMNNYKPGESQYPYHFGPISHYMVNHSLKDGPKDYNREAEDMELNRWSERMVFHTMTGRAENMEAIRKVAREWLDQGEGCARPESVAHLQVG
jgi:hypothetical protein